MTLAVTAVSGRLGSAIATELVKRQACQPVIGLARSPEKVRIRGLELRPGDYTDQASMTASLAGVDTLLMVSLNTPPDIRAAQHRCAIHAARDAGVTRIVYTSVQGAEEGTAFSPVVQSNRETEADLAMSGMEWTIGRNGIYIEPDVEYVEHYIRAGAIANSAGEGLCGFTTRPELASAYANLMLDPSHSGRTYNLHGQPMTQSELAGHLGRYCGVNLSYRPMTVAAYRNDRCAALGEMMGTIIAGIYEGIRAGAYNTASDFELAAGRPHQSWSDYFASLRLT